MPKTNKSRKELFEEKFIPEPNSGCWLWEGSLNSSGYGSFCIGEKETSLAHRFSYQTYRGEIPDDKCVLHRCDNRICVNPDHLWIGTNLDNVLDREAKGRGATIGERNPNSIITENAARHIKAGVLSREQYAKKYGIHETTVRHIQQGRRWAHA